MKPETWSTTPHTRTTHPEGKPLAALFVISDVEGDDHGAYHCAAMICGCIAAQEMSHLVDALRQMIDATESAGNPTNLN